MTPAEIGAAEMVAREAARTAKLEVLIAAMESKENGESLDDFIAKLKAALELSKN